MASKKKKEVEEEESEEEEELEEDEEEEEDTEVTNPNVLNKYRATAEVVNRVIANVVAEIKPGKKIIEICTLGDTQLEEGVKKVYTAQKDMERGVAFPTCISVNEVLGHNSPILPDETEIKEGDVVKIDLGAHIDGYIVMAGTTVVAHAESKQVTGKAADLIEATRVAAECAHRLIKPGKKNSDVTAAIQKVADQFKVTPVEGVLSHQIKRYIVDANKAIINKETLEQKVEEFEFEENEVYCVDILMSTGEGKAKESEARTTVFKRAVDQTYLLKTQAARTALNDINKKFPTFPFTLRALDARTGRLGISEMLKHDLLHSYPVLIEKQGVFVAQIKFTVIILPSSTDRITVSPIPTIQTEVKVEDKAISEILAMGTKRVSKKKKKQAAKKKAAKTGEKKPEEKKPEEKKEEAAKTGEKKTGEKPEEKKPEEKK